MKMLANLNNLFKTAEIVTLKTLLVLKVGCSIDNHENN